MIFQDWKFDRGQCHNGKLSPRKVLLIDKCLIAGEEDFDAIFFGCPQKFTILQPSPTLIGNCENLMLTQTLPQPVIEVFIQ